MTSTNKIAIQNALSPVYPQQPLFDRNCEVNQIYQSLPPSSPNIPTKWEYTAVGPSSMKHLYSGIPNYYPYQKIYRPIGTLYEHDYSQFHENGVGKNKRISYHYKPYPFTDRNVREVRTYSDYILPYMDTRSFTKHPVKYDSSLNSSLQKMPKAFIP